MTIIRAVILLAILTGVVFRCFGIDQKVFWYDEAYTAIPVAGYSRDEVQDILIARSKTGEAVRFEDLRQFQAPNAERSLVDTVVAVAEEEPQNAPLFFIVARGWEQVFGGSLLVMRLLPVLFGLLCIPAIYWLMQELEFSGLASGVGAALLAVSPVHVLYAQEYRQYSLLTLATLIASALLMRAMRTNGKRDWVIFCLASVAGLYSHFFYLFVLAAHALHVACLERFRITARVRRGAIATLTAVAAYLPWIYLVLSNLGAISNWREENVGLAGLAGRWLLALGHLFIDLSAAKKGNPYDLALNVLEPRFLAYASIFLLIVVALVVLVRQARSGALFMALLAAVTLLPLLVPDLLGGGIRSTIPRYLEPVYIAVLVAVAFAFWRGMASRAAALRLVSQVLLVALLGAGILSNVAIAREDTWWNKYYGYRNREFAKVLDRYPEARVSSSDGTLLISLAYGLDPGMLLNVIDADHLPIRRSGEKDFFVFDASPKLISNLSERGCSFEVVLELPRGYTSRSWALYKLRGDPATAPCFADAPAAALKAPSG